MVAGWLASAVLLRRGRARTGKEERQQWRGRDDDGFDGDAFMREEEGAWGPPRASFRPLSSCGQFMEACGPVGAGRPGMALRSSRSVSSSSRSNGAAADAGFPAGALAAVPVGMYDLGMSGG